MLIALLILFLFGLAVDKLIRKLPEWAYWTLGIVLLVAMSATSLR